MSGIARVLRGHGRTVTGCDRSPAAVEELRAEGIDAYVGHDPAHLRPGMELIISTAVEESEPELAAARRQGLRVRHRSDVLADIVASGEGICVAGAHGKTSTTALIAYVLEQCGEDPTYLVGGVVPQLGSNARVGKGRYVVAEADESDGSLARLRPRAALVLNAELDHNDHFASLDDLHALFRAWVAELPREGLVVLHESLDYPAECAIRRYGAGPGEGWRARDVVADGDGTRFVLSAPGRDPLPLRLGVPGAHNALNATAALALLDWAGIAPERAAAPLAEFRGAARRYERRGEVAGIRLVDDYAHHPSELAATLAAARGEAPPGGCWPASSRTCPGARGMFADGFARRCGWPMRPVSATSTSRAARPTRRSRASWSSRARGGRILPSRSPGRPVRRCRRLDRPHRTPGDLVADARCRAGRLRARPRARAPMKTPPGVEADAQLARLTTIGTGGPARFLARPASAPELAEVLAWADAESLDVAVIGLGSNLLVADAGYDGVAVHLEGALAAIEIDGTSVRCGGGASLAAVVRRATEASLTGIEFGCAIPGTVGGAVRMNAGAYGSEIRDVLASAEVVSATRDADGRPGGARAELPALERARGRGGGRGRAGAGARRRATRFASAVSGMQRLRSESQPRKARTFGSVFKNPDEGPGAGALIEACELKGHVIGGARISTVHANFIENTGAARSADVAALVSLARRCVRERFGVDLEHEVELLGPVSLV